MPITAGTTLPILKDDGDWIVVGLRGAAGWIHNPDRSTEETNSSDKQLSVTAESAKKGSSALGHMTIKGKSITVDADFEENGKIGVRYAQGEYDADHFPEVAEDDYCIECSKDGVSFTQMRVCHMWEGARWPAA